MDRIVVGVDGSAGSSTALRWALKVASETGAAVEAVHAWEFSYAWIDGYAPDVDRWAAQAEEEAHACLDRAIAEVVGSRPCYVDVTRTVVEGSPTRALLDHSKDADLLVVGTRGRGGFTGLLLGSVSQQCVHHAHVPVVVVPEPE